MFDQLGCGEGNVLHVSASLRYDLVSAYGLAIKNKVDVHRGYEPTAPGCEYHDVSGIGVLSGIPGL